MPSKKRWISSASGASGSPSDQTRKLSRVRIATEIATTRCCSSDRNSLPDSSRRLRLHHVADLLVAQVVQPVDAPPELHVGNGLDVEDEYGHGRSIRSSGRLPHQHCNGDDQAGLVGQRDVPFADAELLAHLAAALATR